jgi:hypothetical protein
MDSYVTLCILRLLYMLDALPYGYSGLKFTPKHCTHYHIACMNYIYILPVCVLYLHEGGCSEVHKCRRLYFTIYGSLKFKRQETIVYMFIQVWKNVVDTVQRAAVNMCYNVTCNPRKNQEVGTVVPRNVVSHD